MTPQSTLLESQIEDDQHFVDWKSTSERVDEGVLSGNAESKGDAAGDPRHQT